MEKNVSHYSETTIRLNAEIARLKAISERQSAMLAQALKEKNDLLDRANNQNVEYYEGRIKSLQLDLSAVQQRYRDLRAAWRTFVQQLER
jgi:predicted  nucleic acid-binding Zn-ribbon protein